MADWMLSLQLLVLLGITNGTPIFAKWLLQDRFNTPLDGGLTLPDGESLFGASKDVVAIERGKHATDCAS